jgi:pyruvate/2-oxoglutarate dehydrogenase complex dihydrolipoamide dehydrogenase (E3) component
MAHERTASDDDLPIRDFDHVIVGTGQAVGVLLRNLSEDERVAVIEGHAVGGSCVNYGCTPTKTLVASAKVAHQARRSREYGIDTGEVRVDYGAVRARMNDLRHDMRDGMAEWIEGLEHVTLIRGWARFVGQRTLRVGDELVRGARVYLDVGSSAWVPAIDGLDDVPWLDNRRLLDLEVVPEHLVVVGGSYVAVEFAQMFARFGARVTILARGPRLMSREDADVAEAVQEILEDEGLRVELGADVRRVRARDGGGLEVVFERDGEEHVVAGSHLLVAAGRVPNTDRLEPAAGGVETDEGGYVRVDDALRTSAEGVFAMGDVTGESAFTHTATNDGEIVIDVLTGGPRRLSHRIPIATMFMDPPLGRVGLSEREAVEAGHRVLKATMPMTSINRAREMGETKGFAKLLVDADSERLIGATVLGVHGDEVINMLGAFMMADRPWSTFRRTVLVHPTVGELMPWALDGLEPVE